MINRADERGLIAKKWPAFIPVLCTPVAILELVAEPGSHYGPSPLTLIWIVSGISLCRWVIARIIGEVGRGWIAYAVLVGTSIFWVIPAWAGVMAAVEHLRSDSDARVLGINGQDLVDFLAGPAPRTLLAALIIAYLLVVIGANVLKKRKTGTHQPEGGIPFRTWLASRAKSW